MNTIVWLFIHVTIQNNKYLEKNIMSNNEIWLTYIRFPNYNKLKNKTYHTISTVLKSNLIFVIKTYIYILVHTPRFSNNKNVNIIFNLDQAKVKRFENQGTWMSFGARILKGLNKIAKNGSNGHLCMREENLNVNYHKCQ